MDRRIDRVLSARLVRETRERLPQFPEELRRLRQWVRYRVLEPDERGRRGKIPWHATRDVSGSSTNAETWSDAETALSRVGDDATAGVGFVFTADDPFAGIDLDHCFDDDDRLTAEAAEIVVALGSYAERSLSGTGVHVIVRAALPDGRGRKVGGVEVYDRGRYFTVTGDRLEDSPAEVRPAQEALDALLARLEARTPEAPAPPRPNPEGQRQVARGPGRPSVEDRARAYLQRIPPAISGQGGHDQTYGAALAVVRGFDLGEQAAYDLLSEWNGACVPPWSPQELRHKVQDAARSERVPRGYLLADREPPAPRAWRSAGARGDGPAPDEAGPVPPELDEPDKPEVLIPGQHVDDAGEIHEIGMAQFARRALAALPEGALYRRAGVVGELAGAAGALSFEPLTIARLRVLIDEHARLVEWKSKKSKDGPRRRWKRFCACKGDWAQVTLDHARVAPSVRELRTLTCYPVYCGPDFELARPGWNEKFGVFYDAPEALRALETDWGVARCAETLADLVVDFPFADDASRENFFSLLLTPLVRPALDGNVPLFMVQSSKERTGKTKLVEQAWGGVILGRKLSARQLPEAEPEREKRLATIAIRGDTLVHLDNLRDFLDSPALASLLTAQSITIRQMGALTDVEGPNNAVYCCTANNPRATGEIVKRCVPIVLQPETDAPEARTDFQHHDLWSYVQEARPRVLSALLSMIERWRANGRERHELMLGGFERWSQTVGGVLRWTAYGQWMQNAERWRAGSDPLREEVRAFAEQWWAKYGANGIGVKDLLALAEEAELFGVVLKSDKERGRQTAMGQFLRRLQDQPVDTPAGRWIVRSEVYRGHQVYSLEPRAV